MSKRNRYTKELLEPIIKESQSWSEVCRKLGVKPITGAQTHIKKRATDFSIDSSHFLGQGWNRGKTARNKKPLEYYLTKNSTIKSCLLLRRLIAEGIKQARCEVCLLDEWLSERIPLELDHINSDHWDNRLENLQIVCPNCHAAETNRRANRKNGYEKHLKTTPASPTVEASDLESD